MVFIIGFCCFAETSRRYSLSVMKLLSNLTSVFWSKSSWLILMYQHTNKLIVMREVVRELAYIFVIIVVLLEYLKILLVQKKIKFLWFLNNLFHLIRILNLVVSLSNAFFNNKQHKKVSFSTSLQQKCFFLK